MPLNLYLPGLLSYTPEKPDEAHTRLNPTCDYAVDMNFKTCLTFKTVTSHIATKQLSGANMAFPRSLDMYQNKHPVDIGGNCGRLKQNQPMACHCFKCQTCFKVHINCIVTCRIKTGVCFIWLFWWNPRIH
jgi:hypothetical protein